MDLLSISGSPLEASFSVIEQAVAESAAGSTYRCLSWKDYKKNTGNDDINWATDVGIS